MRNNIFLVNGKKEGLYQTRTQNLFTQIKICNIHYSGSHYNNYSDISVAFYIKYYNLSSSSMDRYEMSFYTLGYANSIYVFHNHPAKFDTFHQVYFLIYPFWQPSSLICWRLFSMLSYPLSFDLDYSKLKGLRVEFQSQPPEI